MAGGLLTGDRLHPSKGTSIAVDRFAPIIGGIRPGLFVASNFLPGAPAYTYPESLPMVNASGGPNCRGLPDVPSKQYGGSWYHTPFLVTDNAYVPFQPNTELQFDAPSTLQFLFHGAYAERDDLTSGSGITRCSTSPSSPW